MSKWYLQYFAIENQYGEIKVKVIPKQADVAQGVPGRLTLLGP